MSGSSQQLSLEFKYEGQNFIDINTLLVSQFHFLGIVNQLQRELDPEAKVTIKVGAFREGSFIVDLLLEAGWLGGLFVAKEGFKLLPDLIKTFKEIIELKKVLKGEPAKSETQIGPGLIQINGDNNHVIVSEEAFRIYRTNPNMSKAIEENFRQIDEDPEIEGISITVPGKFKSKETITIEREQFAEMAKPNRYFESTAHGHLMSNEKVYVKRPNLMPEKNKVWKWSLVHKGRDINAKITDNKFKTQIDEGLRLGQGDRLLVDLVAEQKWDNRVGTYVETGKYEITHVYSVIPRPADAQARLDFPKTE